MVIEHIVQTINLILNKNRRGFVKTSQIVTAVRAAMYDFYNSEVEAYKKAGVVLASVKRFVRPSEIFLVNGIGNLPTDFVQEVTFETSCGSEGVFLTPEEYQDRIHSVILDPDQTNPIAKIENNKIVIQPDEFLKITLIYFREPNAFVYATTISQDGRSLEFDSASSVDIEFGYSYSLEIIRRALVYLGIAFQNNEALQLAMVHDDTKTNN
jgi:hypothetical protein